MSEPIFAGFREHRCTRHSESAGAVEIFARVGGAGPPLVLLHGYPQTHRIWRHVAPALADKFTVVAADLRGYGRSSKPRGSASHVEYSKREMAADVVHLMSSLGFDRFDALCHDRGARVAHRLSIDYPGRVGAMLLLDILPTLFVFEHADQRLAHAYFHWFFLSQSHPETEDFILADPKRWWDLYGTRQAHGAVGWTEDDLKEYQDSYFTPEGVHSACEDYRAAATIDLEHDRASRQANERISVRRLKVIWGGHGMLAKMGDPVDVWRSYAGPQVDVTGEPFDSGHYIPEQKPEELLKIALDFFAPNR